MIYQLSVETHSRDDWVDITSNVRQLIHESGMDEGVATVFVPHTTAGVTIQENADPPLRGDISGALDRVFPWRQRCGAHENMLHGQLRASAVSAR